PGLVMHHVGHAIPDYKNLPLFPGMYPTLYPYGIGGFEDSQQPSALAFDCQAKCALNLCDMCFRQHDSYVFVVLNILQQRRTHLQTHFTVQKDNFDLVAHSLTSVSPSILQSFADQLEHKCKLSTLTADKQNAFKLLHQVNTMSLHIPGSEASKIFVRNEIRNYFGYFGLPHIFFTFNPTTAHSPIFQVMYGDKTIDIS
ncbi:hypothetical protein BDR05DRAFT_832199, partial [Suillus weaverae]